jgi:hypothetical protein
MTTEIISRITTRKAIFFVLKICIFPLRFKIYYLFILIILSNTTKNL